MQYMPKEMTIKWIEKDLKKEGENPLTELEKAEIEKNWELSQAWNNLFMEEQKFFWEYLYINQHFSNRKSWFTVELGDSFLLSSLGNEKEDEHWELFNRIKETLKKIPEIEQKILDTIQKKYPHLSIKRENVSIVVNDEADIRFKVGIDRTYDFKPYSCLIKVGYYGRTREEANDLIEDGIQLISNEIDHYERRKLRVLLKR